MSHTSHAQSSDPIERALQRAHSILPDQGPIGVFICHNTLHGFQHLPFHKGVQQGADALGARPYLAMHEFRAEFARGRIRIEDVDDTIARTLGERGRERVVLGWTRAELWRSLMCSAIDEADTRGLQLQDTHDAHVLPSAELLKAAHHRLSSAARRIVRARPTPLRHRDALVALGADDPDTVVHPELIRLCSVFLDHGQALSAMPNRQLGFLGAVDHLFVSGSIEPRACSGVSTDMRRIVDKQLSAHAVIRESMCLLGVPDEEMESYLLATALALPGWSGMFSRLERRPAEHALGSTVSLADLLAVRLVYDRRAAEHVAREHAWNTAWPTLRSQVVTHVTSAVERDAWLVASLQRDAGGNGAQIEELQQGEISALFREIVEFPELLRRQLWQDAYEAFYRAQILDSVAALRARKLSAGALTTHSAPSVSADRPVAQFVFCIDEREESIRRALEEQGGQFQTFGVAGFFGVAIDYRGIDDSVAAAYCPAPVTPAHAVHEAPLYTERMALSERARLRERWNTLSRAVYSHSRTLSGGAGLSLLLGPLAGVLAIARVVSPRGSLAMHDRMRAHLMPQPTTRLVALRSDTDTAAVALKGAPNTKPIGFTIDEAADRVWTLLHNIGLIDSFAPVVVLLGHGSTSVNNPHESAQDCGACGGRRGGANARVFAQMANNRDVRSRLSARGLILPADVWFVGALHDTVSDEVRFFDLDALPVWSAQAFDHAAAALERARGLNAAERSRRFDDAPLNMSPAHALRHVEARASHLAQPRPEYGHCTNAIAVVGRRTLTRGLHLDRRAFLISYDAACDHDDRILERILAAAGPVGAGINLEYYFSAVDNERLGCGTKLPHNVTGLIGVMAGHQGDLRTGLPLQMVELHEPMRLLMIVEASPDALLAVAARQPAVAELVVNEWVQLVSVHPDTGAMQLFRNGQFEAYHPSDKSLPEVVHSAQWHARSRENVRPALITSALPELGDVAPLSNDVVARDEELLVAHA